MKDMTVEEAIGLAVSTLELDSSARCTDYAEDGDYYWLEIRTLLVKYDIYVDRTGSEIVGISTEPETDDEAAYDEPYAVSMVA